MHSFDEEIVVPNKNCIKLYINFRLKITDIKNPALQAVFEHNIPAVMTELEIIKEHETKRNYEHWLTLVFWFATHLEDYNMALSLVS